MEILGKPVTVKFYNVTMEKWVTLIIRYDKKSGNFLLTEKQGSQTVIRTSHFTLEEAMGRVNSKVIIWATD